MNNITLCNQIVEFKLCDVTLNHRNGDVAECYACLEKSINFLLHFDTRDEVPRCECQGNSFIDDILDDLRDMSKVSSDFSEKIQDLLEIFSKIDFIEECLKQQEYWLVIIDFGLRFIEILSN